MPVLYGEVLLFLKGVDDSNQEAFITYEGIQGCEALALVIGVSVLEEEKKNKQPCSRIARTGDNIA